MDVLRHRLVRRWCASSRPIRGPHDRLMTVRGVAARLGVCTASVYRLCQRNELLALRIGGALRFHREDVESFLGRR